MIYYANSHKQPLDQHLIGVTLKALRLLEELKISDEKAFREAFTVLFYCSSLHDIGKLDTQFQSYISKIKIDFDSVLTDAESERKKKFIGPFHNEISFALTAKYYDTYASKDIHGAINYCIYWHHPANLKTETISPTFFFPNADAIEEEVIKNNGEDFFERAVNFYKEKVYDPLITLLYDEFSKKPELKALLELKEKRKSTSLPIYVSQEDDIYWRSIYRLCLNLLIEADRFVSSLKVEELTHFINSPLEPLEIEEKIIELNTLNDERSRHQLNLSEKITNSVISICGIDPGGGKTSVALGTYAKSVSKDGYRSLLIALPRQMQVTGLFYTIQDDIKRMFKNQDNISIEGIFSGKRQHQTANVKTGLLNSDINILTFDRFLSPCYERKQFNEFMTMLRSHLVIDEFHEFAWLPRMVRPLQEILLIRSWIGSGQKTILLSGTPDPALIKLLHIKNVTHFNREELPGVYSSKSIIRYSEDDKDMKQIPDQLVSYNTIDKLHDSLVDFELDHCEIIHSKYRDCDKKGKISDLLKKHGIDSIGCITTTVTAKILQSSFNLNYKNASLKISHPNTDAQTWGRINRFGNKPMGEIFMVKEFDDIIFRKNILGFQETVLRWHSFLKERISEPQQYCTRDLLSFLYDEFWKIEENLNTAYRELFEMVNDAKEDLKDWFPFRDQYRKKKGDSRKGNSGKYGFRGQSLLLSAAIVDNDGNKISQLTSDDLLTISSNYEIFNYKKVIQSPPGKGDKINKLQDETIFSYTKYSRKAGYLEERPFLCSHHNDEVDGKIKDILEKSETPRLHRYYHEIFGLISSEAFEKLKKKS